ncbi:EGF-like domain protein [Ancylostoma duodenale]|uniref:EGF-like domain protein n=1 Tax=Ancylostoma duodenale TaxID=51022 RepID=A0A0C2G1X4_9BILA|nr:EGF-like domain protein [Ancylostoma duodenale]
MTFELVFVRDLYNLLDQIDVQSLLSLLIIGQDTYYHRKDACEPTAVEKEEGVTRENRCTSLQNGICISPEGIALCDCFPGYVGEKCDIYDPCARNPCGKTSECVAIPDETEVKGDLSAQNYRCVCGMSENIDEQNTGDTKCVYTGTGNCSRATNPCNRGECLACQHPEQERILQICTEKERKDGFSCKCVPGTSGTLCEYVNDYCEAEIVFASMESATRILLPLVSSPAIVGLCIWKEL